MLEKVKQAVEYEILKARERQSPTAQKDSGYIKGLKGALQVIELHQKYEHETR